MINFLGRYSRGKNFESEGMYIFNLTNYSRSFSLVDVLAYTPNYAWRFLCPHMLVNIGIFLILFLVRKIDIN